MMKNTKSLIIKRKEETNRKTKEMYLAVTTLSTNSETIGDLEYEISESRVHVGRGNLGIPQMIEKAIPLSKKDRT